MRNRRDLGAGPDSRVRCAGAMDSPSSAMLASVLERNLAEAERSRIRLPGRPSSSSSTSFPPMRRLPSRLATPQAISAPARAGTGTRDDVVASLAEMGIQVGGAHHETGPGQEELDLLTGGALRMADTLLTVREVIRAVAERHGLRANFMPKPLAEAPGSGMHVFQRLYATADGSDALRGEGEAISAQARHVIAGQLGARARHERDRLSDRQLVQTIGCRPSSASACHVGATEPGIIDSRAVLGTGHRFHGRARATIA